MRKMSMVRYAASAALLGSVGLGMAVTLPSSVAGAAKGPVTGTCTALVGDSTDQVVAGCTGGKSTPDGVSQPTGGDTGATITFLNKKTVIESFSYSPVAGAPACTAYGVGTGSILEETENAQITGGTAKFTLGPVASSNVCIYISGTTGAITVINAQPINL
jgi:hypothetical protein